ncbi:MULTISPECIES: pyridoxamine 5'-phosphate oxidase family protein [unclassified Halorubrum]|jgi:nitroimidazol reductase NimA-like FMN-containing flavoprotein (pyridoxamine 5'-phosphate oxidase superfamily)|uniref:pyridoxamine 5'-phosphate oxidase family protein n=1 Tax=unclassified Halorubrum TaxID=2642239 RepID=UPI0010F56D34|nr:MULTISPECIES: pyridoxamine 5'-phosphate oxidase family protein [unclassified Halorubrum]TKX46125.1 pyridoxamine 5'-phosphate oxidase family protein [Halorubrum sp. ARQ200]TKX50034.1 pyridoxamine 5'-phosphate oxidase family protein [Halorubrum sp. ASP121]TKX61541.1 pyridoxamine 5'-phosphate oxidase family protein [Halorubrum sp. ASP1]
MDPTGPWDRDRVDEYLAAARVPVRLGCRTPSDRPWIVSLWFAWDPDAGADPDGDGGSGPPAGAIRCATSASADLVEFVEHDDHVSFDVSTNDPPYKGVRGRGRATVVPDEDKRLLRSLLTRYLGGTDNPTAERLLRPERDEVEIRIEPERLHAWDYSERMETGGE